MDSRRITVDVEIPLVLSVSGEYRPGRPAPSVSMSRYDETLGDPGEDPEVDDVRVELSVGEAATLEALIRSYRVGARGALASFVYSFVSVLEGRGRDPKLPDGVVEAFREAVAESGDDDDGPDPDEKYDSRCDREFDERDRFDQ